MPLEQFAAMPRFRNTMTNALSGVDLASFGFIGLTERFQEEMRRLSESLEFRFQYSKENIGAHPARVLTDVSAERRLIISALNEDDLRLYEQLSAG
jgi:hypothetical protein